MESFGRTILKPSQAYFSEGGTIEFDSNFDIGKRGITVEMDRPRELIYTLGAFRAMGDLAHRWAKRSGITVRDLVGPEMIPSTGADGKTTMVHNPAVITAGFILRNLGDDNLFSIALWGALKKEEPKLALEQVDVIYEAFLEKGGDREDLVGILVEAYARARNPRRLQRARELEKIQAEAAAKAGASEKPPDKVESS